MAPRPRPVPTRVEPPLPARVVGGAWRGRAARCRFAWDGIVETAIRQRNMRIHVVTALGVALVGSAVALSMAERLALLLCIFLVLAAEVANTALEALVDLVTRERHDLARAAKDAGAGAVLVLAAGSVAVFAAVVVHAWPAIAARPPAVVRQAALGVPLAVIAGALLAPRVRPRAADTALCALGLVLLAALAAFTASAIFSALAALLFLLAAAVASRRRRARSGRGL